jgi:hypothetical protein
MQKIVEREKNKGYYRVLHVPIWLWVFFVLPGHLTSALYQHGPDRSHGIWLAIVFIVCAWRGFAGRLPGVESEPYVKYYGTDQPNLPYRMVCYTAAWIDLLVPFILNLLGLVIAGITGRWLIPQLFTYAYYPLAIAIVLATLLNWTPRARRSTKNEGSEKAWFYVAIWTIVPTQVAAWGAWRLGGKFNLATQDLNLIRLAVFLLVGTLLLFLGIKGKLPRSKRYVLQNRSA